VIKSALAMMALVSAPSAVPAQGLDWRFQFAYVAADDVAFRFQFAQPPEGLAFRFRFAADDYVTRTDAEMPGVYTTYVDAPQGRYTVGTDTLEFVDGFKFNFARYVDPPSAVGYEDLGFRYNFADQFYAAETAPAPLSFQFRFAADSYLVDLDPAPFNTSPLQVYYAMLYDKVKIGAPLDDRLGFFVLGQTVIGA
jgi:hypothetical protein